MSSRCWPASQVVIAGYNGPRQTVISGPVEAVERVCALASDKGIATVRIAVSHAFHSPAVAPAAAGLGTYLAGEQFQPLARRVLSTVTGDTLPGRHRPARTCSSRQVLEPVRFSEAVGRMAADVDLLLEVGPGRVLSGLAAGIAAGVPVIALDTEGTSLAGVLSALAAAYVLGAPVRHDQLFRDRFTRPLPLDKEFRFFASPCESVPTDYVAPARRQHHARGGPAAGEGPGASRGTRRRLGRREPGDPATAGGGTSRAAARRGARRHPAA